MRQKARAFSGESVSWLRPLVHTDPSRSAALPAVLPEARRAEVIAGRRVALLKRLDPCDPDGLSEAQNERRVEGGPRPSVAEMTSA